MKTLFAFTLAATIAAGTCAPVAAQTPSVAAPAAAAEVLTLRTGLRFSEIQLHDPYMLPDSSTRT